MERGKKAQILETRSWGANPSSATYWLCDPGEARNL